jgi:hypothetical protein
VQVEELKPGLHVVGLFPAEDISHMWDDDGAGPIVHIEIKVTSKTGFEGGKVRNINISESALTLGFDQSGLKAS